MSHRLQSRTVPRVERFTRTMEWFSGLGTTMIMLAGVAGATLCYTDVMKHRGLAHWVKIMQPVFPYAALVVLLIVILSSERTMPLPFMKGAAAGVVTWFAAIVLVWYMDSKDDSRTGRGILYFVIVGSTVLGAVVIMRHHLSKKALIIPFEAEEQAS